METEDPPGTSYSTAMADRLLTQKQVAEKLRVSVRTVSGWRTKGGGVPFVRLNARVVRYRISDLEAWLEARLVTSTSDPSPTSAKPIRHRFRP